MDYCSSCRRHLNGALVCPGCGAYAPDIAPVTVSRPPVQPRVTLAAATTPAAQVPDLSDSPSHGTYDGDTEGEGAYGHEGFPGATPAPQGRAARRCQRARWKKNQRRAVVATAVALVGGGLTFTAMDRLSADRAEAASAPDAAGLGANTRTNAGTNAGSAQEEETRYTRPPSTRPDAGRPSADASTRSPASGRSAERGPVAPSSVAPQGSRPDAPASDTASASGRRSRSAASGSSADSSSAASSSSSSSSEDTSGGTAPQPSAPAGTDGTNGSGGTGGSDPATSPASPSPSATSPSQLCLLVLCIG